MYVYGSFEGFLSFTASVQLITNSHMFSCPTDNLVKDLHQKQESMQKLLEEDLDRHRKIEEKLIALVKNLSKDEDKPGEIEQLENKGKKLFPESALFQNWGGENLSEDEQKEAQALFDKYGYNVFLSDRLPLNRPLPDTRDPRLTFFLFPVYVCVCACVCVCVCVCV